MGEFGGQNAYSTLNTDCESGIKVRIDIWKVVVLQTTTLTTPPPQYTSLGLKLQSFNEHLIIPSIFISGGFFFFAILPEVTIINNSSQNN